MIEYPSIINSSKAPREPCVAFYKYDGSNIRVKYTHKKGFCLFGSRHQLFDETHPFLAGSIPYFMNNYADELNKIFKKEEPYKAAKEIIVFGEYFGEKSFAGIHETEDQTKKFIMFDVMANIKNRYYFQKPQSFIKMFSDKVEIPDVVYEGNLNDSFIQAVKQNSLDYKLNEGVICKGLISNGAFSGNVWMCKVKTDEYLLKLKHRFKDDWEKYV